MKNIYDKTLSTFNRDYLSVPEFRTLYQGIYDQFAPQGKQNGGRIMKAWVVMQKKKHLMWLHLR
jgi:hypothetical protein